MFTVYNQSYEFFNCLRNLIMLFAKIVYFNNYSHREETTCIPCFFLLINTIKSSVILQLFYNPIYFEPLKQKIIWEGPTSPWKYTSVHSFWVSILPLFLFLSTCLCLWLTIGQSFFVGREYHTHGLYLCLDCHSKQKTRDLKKSFNGLCALQGLTRLVRFVLRIFSSQKLSQLIIVSKIL